MAGTQAGLFLPTGVLANLQADASLGQATGGVSALMGNVTAETFASFTLTISGGTGTVGISSLGGVAAGMTATWASSDAATTAALTTQLNALSTVNKAFVFTNPTTTTVVATCRYAGVLGNSITGTGTGTGVTPASATAFTGGGPAFGATGDLPGGKVVGAIGDVNRLLQVVASRFSWST